MPSATVSVYAITNSRTVPKIRGMRAVRVGTLAALVSDTRRPPAPTPANLRRFHSTVAAIADALPAALPARFGTTMTEPELAMVLHLRAPSFRSALRQVRRRVQMTLRLPARPPVKTTAAGPSRPPARSGREYLRARADQYHDVPGFAPVRAALRRWVDEERIDRHGEVVSVYHLVPRRAASIYTRAATAALADAGVRGVVSGPFPPFAFGAL